MEKFKLIVLLVYLWTLADCFKMRDRESRQEDEDVQVEVDDELDAECRIDQECVPIRSCQPILQLLVDVKDEPQDSKWRSHAVSVVRERICGELEQNMICCPQGGIYDQVLKKLELFRYQIVLWS